MGQTKMSAVFFMSTLAFLAIFASTVSAQTARTLSWYVGGGYNSATNQDHESGLHVKANLGIKVPEDVRFPFLGLTLYEFGPSVTYNYLGSRLDGGKLSALHVFWIGRYGRFAEDDFDLENKLWPIIVYGGLGPSFESVGSDTETTLGIEFGVGLDLVLSPRMTLLLSVGIAGSKNSAFAPLGVQLSF